MTFTADAAAVGVRLDSYIASLTELSRSAAARLIESGDVLVSGRVESKKYLIKEGDRVEITLPEAEEYEAEPENIPLSVIYEDGDIIVINKPKGMVVHPAPGNYSGTLVNALLYHCRGSLSGIGGVMRPGIVHRIDKDTSGLLVVAKNDMAHRALSSELSHHGIVREYHALALGGFSCDGGTISLPIGRHPKDRKRMAVHPAGSPTAKEAITHYEVAERLPGVTYLRLRLETGRTHQIRVHMSHLGHPLLFDEVYGGGKTQFEKRHARRFFGQTLHAARLSLTHPRTQERMEFECPLPEYFTELLELLRQKN
ncbi:MAG: RluA family pseudouridine synthase [Clostridia bacterium]|nr:RluA family pseudouridine synthase [Clostridia bacterium]